ncbi:hypothetical protein [Pseudorhodoplanes sinuspersici]|uniref:Uncharacterized protein n=1 Tax=Pseudorhodoplanes sinuspersici TaxID=1235591 RepID=A0A1W6ZZR4_9HYPH|nr:hypothetical protein [Pseudorhodoplanes sinuspersici]ARQ02245.1 hypothetical protein CAK95_26450 [Pseudorhodoplanes sinuspersici]RKE74066.1 hypothetical protein DFP91_1966 [Pseudorhodoplanes sinuspersici]
MVFDIGSQGRLIGRAIGFATLVMLVLSTGPALAQNIFDLFKPPPPPPPQQQMPPPQQRSQPAPRPQKSSPPRVQKSQPAPAVSTSPNAPFGEVRSACGAEIRSTCAGVVPGSADSVQCLKRNFAVHSPACQAALTRAGNPAVQPVAAPAKITAPAGTAEEPRRVSTDRVEPASAPAEPLKMAPVTKLRPTQEARFVNRYCREDQSLLCQGVPYGQGRVLTCLAGQQASLTSECKKALVSRR